MPRPQLERRSKQKDCEGPNPKASSADHAWLSLFVEKFFRPFGAPHANSSIAHSEKPGFIFALDKFDEDIAVLFGQIERLDTYSMNLTPRLQFTNCVRSILHQFTNSNTRLLSI